VSIPCVFLTTLAVWAAVDNALGAREVSRFLREHRALVARRLTDPRVHSFSLSHDPGHPATLVIRFDVDTKAAYEMLENDLGGIWGLRFPARWETRLRNDEDLGNNFGFAAQGISAVAKFCEEVLTAAAASLLFASAYLAFALRRPRGGKGAAKKPAGVDDF